MVKFRGIRVELGEEEAAVLDDEADSSECCIVVGIVG